MAEDRGNAMRAEEKVDDPKRRNCGRCHKCGAPIDFQNASAEWCAACEAWQHPASHGWTHVEKDADKSPCITQERRTR